MFLLIYIIPTYFVYVSTTVNAFERKLGIEKFNCTNSTGTRLDDLTIIEAVGEKDKLYYFWDFGSKPTFLIIQVPLKTKVKLNCDKYLNGSKAVQFTSKPTFIFGVVLNKLYEFNDVNDTASMNPNDTTIQTYNGEDFHWSVSVSQNTEPIALDAFIAVGRPLTPTNSGFLKVAAGAYAGDGCSIDPPHILHTANASQIDIILDNFQTISNASRFAVEFTVISSMKDMNYTSVTKKTVDDENTPGVFNLDTLTFKTAINSSNDRVGYLLWRPVVYTTKEKVVTSTTKTSRYNVTDVVDKSKLLNSTLLKAIYGNEVINLFAKAQNISFGSRTDKFYQNTRYSSWSFVIGIETVPGPEGTSFLIMIAFVIGLISSLILAVLLKLKLILSVNSPRSQQLLMS